MAGQAKRSTARARPARPISAALAGSRTTAFSPLANAAAKAAGSRGSPVASSPGSIGHEQAGDAVVDDLDDAAGGRGHDGRLARHRLEVDDAQRLVDRRAREDRRVAEDLDHVGLGQHLVEPEHVAALRLQLLDAARDLGSDLRRVRGAGAEHELRLGVDVAHGLQQVRDALLAGDAPHEDDGRHAGVDAVALEDVGARIGRVLLGVDAVVDHRHAARVDRGVGGRAGRRAMPSETATIASAASTAVRSQNDDSA